MGPQRLAVDGFDEENCVYQFHGFWFHGHKQCRALDRRYTGILKKYGNAAAAKFRHEMKEKFRKTLKNDDYIRKCGYQLVVIYECEWIKMKEKMGILRRLHKIIAALHSKGIKSAKF